MNLSANINVSAIAVFLEGLLSFFSPCVLPLIPVYIGYLSGGTLKKDEDGNETYDGKKVLINTIFFVIGISVAFFLLGLGMSVVGKFFNGNRLLFARIGGIIVVLFGIYQIGWLGQSRLLNGEYRLPIKIEKMTMSPLAALLMGFVLSFAWSPCVGPVLSSVLIMAASASSSAAGFGLIGVYTLGYILPFLLLGLFTTKALSFFAKHRNVVKYTARIGGVLLIVMGLLMFTGKMNTITGYLSQFSGAGASEVSTQGGSTAEEGTDAESTDTNPDSKDADSQGADSKSAEDSSAGNQNLIPAQDFTLVDQYGQTHTLSDYRGKIVFLNFWATWCPPCRAELPDIQSLYEDYQAKEDSDVVILGVAFPDYNNEKSVEGVTEFLEENGITYPVLMDTEASLILPYYLTAYPTTYMIDVNGNVTGYVPGSISKDIMESIIDETRAAGK